MVSSFGPISGTGRLLQWDYPGVVDPVFTTGGRLIFADQQTDWRFTAVVVDAPASLALPGPGLAAMSWVRRLRA
jgi:hypothetical protein